MVAQSTRGFLASSSRPLIRVPVPNYPYAENCVERIASWSVGERVTVETTVDGR